MVTGMVRLGERGVGEVRLASRAACQLRVVVGVAVDVVVRLASRAACQLRVVVGE